MASRWCIAWAAVGLGLGLGVGPALAETLTRDVQSGRGAGLFPIMAIVWNTCQVYQGRDVAITVQPQNGAARIINHTLALGEAAAHCKGKTVTVPWLAYQSKPGFKGTDSVSVSYRVPSNTGEMTLSFITVTVEVTVK